MNVKPITTDICPKRENDFERFIGPATKMSTKRIVIAANITVDITNITSFFIELIMLGKKITLFYYSVKVFSKVFAHIRKFISNV